MPIKHPIFIRFMEPEKPLQEQKKEAMLRRADRFLAQLRTPDYVTYSNEDAAGKLIALIDLIIWALEMSIPKEEWQPFLLRFRDAKYLAGNIEGKQEDNYKKAITLLTTTLSDYETYILLPNVIR